MMSGSPLKRLLAAAGWLWWLLDASRRALLNLLMLLVLATLVWLFLHRGPPPLQDDTALVLAPHGPIREQFSGTLRDNALREARGETIAQTRLRDVLAALDGAAHDPQIARVVLVLDDFAGAGMPTLREVAAALQRFRASGKQVVAWGSGYDQRQYYLAAQANEVWMNPMGSVDIEGFGGYRTYYKDALDKFGFTAHVVRAGQFKNAEEAFVANGPSKPTQEADKYLLDGLWASYTAGIEHARKLAPGSIDSDIAELPERLAAAGGDFAKLALQNKLVDALKTRDQLRAALIARGVRDGQSFRQIPFEAYLARVRPAKGPDAVGVLVAEGPISDGDAPGGAIGGASTSELIRRAREDEHIKALVLRVDSPGGSVFGSELVRRELELTRKAGKPVVVSMGDVAASGGYWISTASDEIIADETTVTGSIGVIAMLPTAEHALAKLGVHTGGYTTTWLAGAYDPRHGLDPRYEKVLQNSINHTYAEFTQRVAAARRTTPAKIDAVGQGRVWSGAQALERGLVDRTGSFEDALQSAAQRAKLAPGYRVVYVEREPGRTERLLSLFASRVAAALGPDVVLPAWLAGVPPAVLQGMRHDLSWLMDVGGGKRRFAALTHCLCSAP
jgi:protease-4